MLLLAVFCTIGMSFTPAEEGENVGNPNDSTYVTGPRRSSSSSCSGMEKEYKNATDYGRVEVRMIVWDESGSEVTIEHSTVGSVTLEGETTSKTTSSGATFEASISDSGTEGNTAYINWNSNLEDDFLSAKIDDEYNRACHTLTVTVTAIPIEGTVYEFYGWTKRIMQKDESYNQVILPPTKKPTGDELEDYQLIYKDEIILGDVNDDGAEEGFTSTTSSGHITIWEEDANPHTVIYYAHFAPPAPVEITLGATKNGSYTYTDGTQSGTISNNTDGSIETSKQITLTATPASDDYKFYGWYEKDNNNQEKYLSYDASWSKKFTVPTTIYAKFIPKDAALFIIKGVDGEEYWNLNEACTKAQSSSKVVLPKANGTLYPLVDGELCTSIPAGKTATDYTIPSGVTLLIPYDDDNSIYTKPEQKHESNTSPSSKPTCYCLLTLHDLCTISVNGTLNIAANIFSANGGNYCSGSVFSKYGRLDMKKDSKININSSAKLYCWGFITGTEGLVTVKGEVNEMFQMHNPGGSQLRNWKNKALFITQYYIQNIETPMRIYSGAKETVHATVYITGYQNANATLVGGTDGLFRLTGEESYFEKRYDPITDRQIFEINGSAELNYLSLTVSFYTISTEKVPLPISNNITILSKVLPKEESSTLTCNYGVALLPGSELIIDKGVKVENKASIYIYDQEEWKEGFAGLNSDLLKPVRFSPTKNITRTKDDLIDAKFEINGTLNIDSNGAIYTTIDNERTRKGSANICSAGTGIIKYNGNAGTETETYLYAKNDLSTPVTIPITAAQLHNDESKPWNQDEKYTPTAGAVAGDEFVYSQYYGKWLKNPKVITWDATTNGGTCETPQTVLPPGTKVPELPIAIKIGYTFKGWFTEASGGTQITTETPVIEDVIYYAQFEFIEVEPQLDIIDADGTNLTINANGWASSGWPYTINDIPYEKNARQTDRTLDIPYSGQPNNDMPIEVKDKEGTVVSCHMYKVPFVYTGTENMNAMNENSIVFVKSGTLTVGTASAKEIYVAPGAELKVTGKLTVGKLVLRTKPYEAAILTIENGGAIADGGQVYYSRISPDAKQYYQFGLPLSCPLANVKMSNTDKLGGSQPKYGTAWMLKFYNDSLRAHNGISDAVTNWTLLENTRDITAGVGYEMFSNSKYYREFYFPVNLSEATTQVSVQYTEGTKGEEHNGWNIITSPYTGIYTVAYKDPATAIKVCWLNEDGSYIQEQPTVIPPAIPFSYQASAKGALAFDTKFTFAAAAPRKQSAAEALTETEWIHLDIFDAYGEGDETSLFVHPTRFEQTYKTGIDVAKQSLTASRPIIYSTHAYGDMAFAGVADSLLENGIDIAVYSPAAQELTFSLRENKFLNRLEYLWLADNETGARTDLLMDDYTCRADAGTAKGRFVLNGRFKAPQISTGIGNTRTDYNIYAIGNNIAISGVEQGTPIYVFDAVGHMIYTTAATSDEVIVPAPCAGVYMLTIGGQTAKLVINK